MATTLPNGDPITFYSPEAFRHNAKVLLFIRSCASGAAGIAAGILGLQNYSGFIFYAVISLILGFILWLGKTGANSKRYFISPLAIWTDEVGGNAVSFLLFWTLSYGLVHIYE